MKLFLTSIAWYAALSDAFALMPRAANKTCPLDLSGPYEVNPHPLPSSQPYPRKQQQQLIPQTKQYPHLIVPIDSTNPTTALGTSYNGTITPTISSIYNFDVPASDAGKTCNLVFLFPLQSQLETSSFSISGGGDIDFFLLDGVADAATTFANAPVVKQDYGMAGFVPGNTYSVASFACPAGQSVGVLAKACGDTVFSYFQDYNPAP